MTALAYRWNLRLVMANHEMFQTTELVPLLAARGVALSAVQVYRLVTQTPERLSLKTLMALCDIFSCTPNDLIEPVADQKQRRAAGEAPSVASLKGRRPRRADITGQ